MRKALTADSVVARRQDGRRAWLYFQVQDLEALFLKQPDYARELGHLTLG
jgi:hypothetical protein